MEKELTHKEISSWIASVREDLVYEPPGLREDMDKACRIIESLQARIVELEEELRINKALAVALQKDISAHQKALNRKAKGE